MKNWLLPVRLPLLSIIFLKSFYSISQPVAPPIAYTSVISGLDNPIDLVHAGDGSNRIFIAQQGGDILVYDADFDPLGTFLTVTGIVSGGEQGLLSIAFHPDYENTNPLIGGFFYVYYTNAAGNLELARYHVSSSDPNVADAASKQVVMTIPHPTNSNHNGGKLNFGIDGFLYFATGDGGGGGDPTNNAQRGNTLLGKMLRINVTNSATVPFYTIPPGNPYAGAGDPLDEIWAFGLRNPFRWSFDRQTQDMWIGDVGQAAWEEIDYRPSGSTGGVNYGWRCYEGTQPFNTTGCLPANNYIQPVFQYQNPPTGQAAVTGGVVYRGNNFPVLRGYYFSADVYTGDLFLTHATTFTTTTQPGMTPFVVCFGETEAGEVYAVSLDGNIYNVGPDGPLPVSLINFTAATRTGFIELEWKTVSEQNLLRYVIEYSTDGSFFVQAGSVPAKNDMNGATYLFNHYYNLNGRVYYRIRIEELNGDVRYSDITSVLLERPNRDFVHPSVINTGMMDVYVTNSWQSLELVDMQGALVMRKDISGQTGRIQVPLKPTLHGVYFVRLRNGLEMLTQRIIIMK